MARRPAHQLAAVTMAMAVVLLLAAAHAPAASAAVSCGQVASTLSPCIMYATGRVKAPLQATGPCCNAVRGLNSAANNPADRRATCTCLKQQTAAIAGIDPNLVAGIPSKCGVNIPYAIRASTDCSKVN